MDWEITGYFASVITVASFIPQLWKGFRSKSLSDLSYLWPGLLVISSSLWTAYGFALHSYPIWVSNILLVIMNLMLIIMKYLYSRK
ncbi:MAG: SemiSWEET family transporter [Candidatus Woesearchaeota archaeon]